jgi:hypothetical protein
MKSFYIPLYSEKILFIERRGQGLQKDLGNLHLLVFHSARSIAGQALQPLGRESLLFLWETLRLFIGFPGMGSLQIAKTVVERPLSGIRATCPI